MHTRHFILQFVISFFSIVIISSVVSATDNMTEVTYRLKWLFNTSVVGDLYTDTQGIFKAHGLDVTVKAGGPERDAIRELELGHAQFGVASADQVIRALAKGSPVVVIAQLFQVNPLQWIYRDTGTTINNLSDLKGKTIGITYGGNDETIMRSLLAKAELREKDVNLYSVRYDYTQFYQGKVDIWPVYVNAQGIILSEKLNDAGESVQFFNPADFGIQFVANSVVTSEKMIKEHPETVQMFITALLKGWEASLLLSNKDLAIQTIRQFDKDTVLNILEQQLEITRKLIKPNDRTLVGQFNIEAWKQTEAIMLEQKQIKKPVHVENVLKQITR
ncbi:MAG: ABC transporter substrate-binding protein [Desulfobacterales bacterium]|nr:ABC transporter substrate-binding protein [Desulfobacterales bacterium]